MADGAVRGGVPESLRQGPVAQRGLKAYFRFYNDLRPHQALHYRTPAEVFYRETVEEKEELNERKDSPEQGIELLAGEPGTSLNSALFLSN